MAAKLTQRQQREAEQDALGAAIRVLHRPEVAAALKELARQPVAKAVADAAKVLSDTIESVPQL